ncbi:asparaginase [Brevibacillus choshinensis]|uniref:Asparaginase n=1 Tax=Brevibacillus choshinensis TaxID=54911 RepID=A0ABX7FQN9_BRECH|nr:asparaginase [Brevibacillus choshinensis]QRG67612.1 asparaginase [Brevibacillus choshinensis]
MEETLVVVKRGSHIESVHTGSIAVVDWRGNLLYGVGDVERTTFTRSSLKPIQAIPLVQSGAADRFLFNDKEIAICCGSHNGEEQHTQVVRSMLFRIGLQEENLQCGSHPPYSQEHYLELVKKHVEPGQIHNNCSGKHTGMLALAMHLESDIATYHQLEHPVQRKVLDTLLELAEIGDGQVLTGIDGCGVPNFAIPLTKLAQIFAKLAHPVDIHSPSLKKAIQRITQAMMQYPEMVSGTNEFCTEVMKVTKGRVIAKGGAEGVYSLGLMEKGIGIAIKVADGNWRSAYPAAVEALLQLEELSPAEAAALRDFHVPAVTNRKGEHVGSVEPVFALKEGKAFTSSVCI